MAKVVDPDYAASIMQKNNLNPLEPYPGAAKPWQVQCVICGTFGSPTFAHINARGGGCKFCGKKRSADSKRVNPDAAVALMRLKGFEPLETFRAGKSPWKCIHITCGSLVSPQYTNVAGGQGGCKYCGKLQSANKRRLDATEVTAEIIKLGFIPLQEYPGSKKKWACKCVLCGSKFLTTLEQVRGGAHPLCIHCNRKQMGIKRRTSNEVAVTLMKQVGLSPLETFPGASKLWKCKCNLCHSETNFRVISARLRIAKDHSNPYQGCEECVFARIGKERLLDQAEAERRLGALNMKIIGTYLGTHEPVKAVCGECGAENEVQLGKAFYRGRACNHCSLRGRAAASRTPEATAIARMLKAGFRPLVPYVNYNAPWKSTHLACGNEVSPSLGAIKNGGGCPSCAKYGFDMTSPAVLYVLYNHKYQAVKVGITGINTNRIQRLYKQHGWTIVKWFRFKTGREARDLERVILNWWRTDLNLSFGIEAASAGKLGGWTETVPSSDMSPENVVKFARSVMGSFDGES